MKTQEQILLDHFAQRPTITPMEAHTMYKIRSLTRRITELKRQGHVINRTFRRDQTGQRYARYTYICKKETH